MTTAPFTRPALVPPAPCWIVRAPPREDTIEIVFSGHANRAELEAAIERLSRWGWPLEEDGEVAILADMHADAIGVRLSHLQAIELAELVRIVSDLLGGAVVAEANHNEWRAYTRRKRS